VFAERQILNMETLGKKPQASPPPFTVRAFPDFVCVCVCGGFLFSNPGAGQGGAGPRPGAVCGNGLGAHFAARAHFLSGPAGVQRARGVRANRGVRRRHHHGVRRLQRGPRGPAGKRREKRQDRQSRWRVSCRSWCAGDGAVVILSCRCTWKDGDTAGPRLHVLQLA
jgi:hypothetical protein